MAKTNAYIEIAASPLREMIDNTDKFLRNLVSSKQMSQALMKKLRPSRTESELPHMYYNPKDHKIGDPLRSIVSGMKSPPAKLSSLLDKTIRPLFDKHTPYSLPNSIIFLKHLKEFRATEKTNIYTFDITDLYTMIPQREAVLAVCEFLGRHGYRKVQGLSINTIKTLFLHVLENAYFVLQLPGSEPKFYRQIRGGPMGLSCTQVLADIYVRSWEAFFVEQQRQQNELYFRFREDIFLTTKLLPEQIEIKLTEFGKKDPNLAITWEGGNKVNYLDISVTVKIPNFRTTVYRKLAAQPYILPFHSSHPLHITRNIPHAAALRATRICSHAEDLQRELDKIRVMLLLNKYPPAFINKHVGRFSHELTGDRTPRTLLGNNHKTFREIVMDLAWNKKDRRKINFGTDILVHFSYSPSLAHFGSHFHQI
jgi:hypothetical protein